MFLSPPNESLFLIVSSRQASKLRTEPAGAAQSVTLDHVTLPSTGKYRVMFDPTNTMAQGTINVAVWASTDITVQTTADGSPTTVGDVRVQPTPNPSFRRVDAQVFTNGAPILKLSTVMGRY